MFIALIQCETYSPVGVPFQSVAKVVHDLVRSLECCLVESPVMNWVVVKVHISVYHQR